MITLALAALVIVGGVGSGFGVLMIGTYTVTGGWTRRRKDQ